jgi:SAM-dependent methyltransferase
MHSHGIDLKKRGAFLRIKNRRRRRLPVPWYGYELSSDATLARRQFELVLGWVFRICQWRLPRVVLRAVPDALLGKAFVVFRNTWKARTKKVKRQGLQDVAYRLSDKTANSMPRNEAAFSITDVEAHWDRVASIYEAANNTVQQVHDQRFVVGVPLLRLKGREQILNVWSRDGGAIPFIREAAPHADLTNAELSENMLAIGQRNYPNEIFLKLDDLLRLPFPDSTFDRVLSLETLEHAPIQEVFISEVLRVAKPGGLAVLSAPPRSAEAVLRVYETFFENHGEGPHRFPSPKRILEIIDNSGGELVDAFPSLIFPFGPRWLRRRLDRLATKPPIRNVFFHLGLRHFYVFRKL